MRMKFKSHISNPLLLSRLKLIAVGLFTAISCLLINPITAHASFSFTDAELKSVVQALYNGTSSSNRGGNSTIQNGVAYTRTGYLCYLLTKDGATTGDPAYAFSSPGFNGIAGSKWVCTSRRGHSVSGWTGTAPWGVTPWQELGTASNEPKIKEWALAVTVNGKPNAQQFVFEQWGVEAEKNFQSDEYILVIETIMNFQYSVKGGDGGSSEIVYITRRTIDNKVSVKADEIIKSMTFSATADQQKIRKSIIKALTDQVVNELKKDPNVRIVADSSEIPNDTSAGGSGRTFTSDPLIGTVPNLIQYKNGNTVFNSYTNKVAPHAEKIKVSEAGFEAYTGSGSTQLSDSEVQSYGVAMLIIHCKNDSIHTYWEPNHSSF